MTVTATEFRWLTEQSVAPRVRTMREFCEQEIVIPDGPFEGRRFKVDRQPFVGLLLDAYDSGQWRRFAITGPSQSGKTLIGTIIPTAYHLFELNETVAFGLPDMDMAGDKWQQDLAPVIQRTRYRDLIPSRGAGSRGGKARAMIFGHGVTLRFLSAGGGDKSRAGFTARVLVATEVDGYDDSGEASREADKLTQMEARLKADEQGAREYLECTTSIERGRIWQEYSEGTRSKIAIQCPICMEGVTPEREHIRGWEDADHEVGAFEGSAWHCPECGAPWTEAQRVTANENCVLVHRGQDVETVDGKLTVTGPPPPTRTLGFRWSAVNNLFRSAGSVGVDCWKAERSENLENDERYLCQFVFADPYVPPIQDVTPLDPYVLRKRTDNWPRGLCPHDMTHIAMGIDVGKWQLHWGVPCWRSGLLGHLLDYGSTPVPSQDMDEDLAILTGLRELADQIREGWAMENEAKPVRPQVVLIDSGYKPEVVYQFCKEQGKPFYPSRGHSALKRWKMHSIYSEPKNRNRATRHVGDQYHLVQMKEKGVLLWHVNADHWKTWVHRRLRTPQGAAGSLGFFSVKERNYHMDLVKSLTAEKQVEEFQPGKGTVLRWEVVRKNKSHWLDAISLGCVGLHYVGARLTPSAAGAVNKPTQTVKQKRVRTKY